MDLTGRHFLSMLDLTREEILAVLKLANDLKARNYSTDGRRLAGKTLAMIFQKPSLRTRVSFETGMTRLGGHAIYLAPTDVSLGQRETTEDVALVLSRYADVIMARVFGHNLVEELARHSTVPVINGLSDHEHPCQILADFQTILERRGRLDGVKACFIGDGNNVCHSLMLGAARVGMHFTAITPAEYQPRHDVVSAAMAVAANTRARIDVANDLSAVKGMEVVYTDVWASMGQEAEAEARRRIFRNYRIDKHTLSLAAPGATILHCLPAHYGDEIDYEASRLPNSAIFDQAENRMHAQNALLCLLLGAAAESDSPAAATADEAVRAKAPGPAVAPRGKSATTAPKAPPAPPRPRKPIARRPTKPVVKRPAKPAVTRGKKPPRKLALAGARKR